MTKNHKKTLALLAGLVALYFVVSTLISYVGLFNQPNQPPIYFLLFFIVPVSGFLLAYFLNKSVRQALLAMPLWFIVFFNIFRFEATMFILDVFHHTLPPLFGWTAGIGDIVTATFAIPLTIALYRGYRSKWLRVGFLAWNTFGMLDLLNAVTLGILYSVSVVGILSSPGLNSQIITFLPQSIIPTFYVPLLLLLHLLAYRRNKEVAK